MYDRQCEFSPPGSLHEERPAARTAVMHNDIFAGDASAAEVTEALACRGVN